MPDVVDSFTAQHFTLNSISEPRQAQVRAALLNLSEWLDKPIEEATASDLRGWLVALLNEGRAASTVAWYLGMVRPFYRWCWRERVISADEWMRIAEVAPPRGHASKGPRPYSRKELTRMWTELDAKFPYQKECTVALWHRGTGRVAWRRMRRHVMRLQLDAIIELALVCGLRRNEIYCLSVDDVHPDNKYIVVHGKRVDQNPKVREVPYPDSTREAIRAWFRMRAWLNPPAGLKLWLSLTGPNPTAELSEARMAVLLHSFGDWTLHRLRHTCATERLRAGMKLEELRDFLGHANITQTLAYAQLVREDIHKSSGRIDADFQKAIRRAA